MSLNNSRTYYQKTLKNYYQNIAKHITKKTKNIANKYKNYYEKIRKILVKIATYITKAQPNIFQKKTKPITKT